MLQTLSNPALLIINSGSSSLKFLVAALRATQENQRKNLGQNLFRGQLVSIGGSSQLQIRDEKEQILHSQSSPLTITGKRYRYYSTGYQKKWLHSTSLRSVIALFTVYAFSSTCVEHHRSDWLWTTN